VRNSLKFIGIFFWASCGKEPAPSIPSSVAPSPAAGVDSTASGASNLASEPTKTSEVDSSLDTARRLASIDPDICLPLELIWNKEADEAKFLPGLKVEYHNRSDCSALVIANNHHSEKKKANQRGTTFSVRCGADHGEKLDSLPRFHGPIESINGDTILWDYGYRDRTHGEMIHPTVPCRISVASGGPQASERTLALSHELGRRVTPELVLSYRSYELAVMETSPEEAKTLLSRWPAVASAYKELFPTPPEAPALVTQADYPELEAGKSYLALGRCRNHEALEYAQFLSLAFPETKKKVDYIRVQANGREPGCPNLPNIIPGHRETQPSPESITVNGYRLGAATLHWPLLPNSPQDAIAGTTIAVLLDPQGKVADAYVSKWKVPQPVEIVADETQTRRRFERWRLDTFFNPAAPPEKQLASCFLGSMRYEHRVCEQDEVWTYCDYYFVKDGKVRVEHVESMDYPAESCRFAE
jgi:hypothetical protein